MKLFKSSNLTTPRERESKLVRKLAILNILLTLTIIFLIVVLFDLASYFENPPWVSGVFNVFK